MILKVHLFRLFVRYLYVCTCVHQCNDFGKIDKNNCIKCAVWYLCPCVCKCKCMFAWALVQCLNVLCLGVYRWYTRPKIMASVSTVIDGIIVRPLLVFQLFELTVRLLPFGTCIITEQRYLPSEMELLGLTKKEKFSFPCSTLMPCISFTLANTGAWFALRII